MDPWKSSSSYVTAEVRLRHWLSVLRNFAFLRPSAAQLDLLRWRENSSCVELDMATTFSRDEKF